MPSSVAMMGIVSSGTSSLTGPATSSLEGGGQRDQVRSLKGSLTVSLDTPGSGSEIGAKSGSGSGDSEQDSPASVYQGDAVSGVYECIPDSATGR